MVMSYFAVQILMPSLFLGILWTEAFQKSGKIGISKQKEIIPEGGFFLLLLANYVWEKSNRGFTNVRISDRNYLYQTHAIKIKKIEV